MVARMVWDHEAPGSSPGSPTSTTPKSESNEPRFDRNLIGKLTERGFRACLAVQCAGSSGFAVALPDLLLTSLISAKEELGNPAAVFLPIDGSLCVTPTLSTHTHPPQEPQRVTGSGFGSCCRWQCPSEKRSGPRTRSCMGARSVRDPYRNAARNISQSPV